jgi:hypothetical protein
MPATRDVETALTEVHDPRLLDAERSVHPSRGERGQMRETAECTVCKHDITTLQLPMDTVCEGHVGRTERSDGDTQQHSRTHVKESHEVGYREAAAATLKRGLAESLLQIGRVRHRTSGAIHHPDTMPEPKPGVRHAPSKAATDDDEQPLKHLKRQATAGKPVGLGGHLLAQKPGHMAAGRVAVKDLKEESMNRGGWVKFPPPPGMSALMANRFDRGGVQCEANILLDLRHDSLDNGSHKKTSLCQGVASATTILTGGLLFCA